MPGLALPGRGMALSWKSGCEQPIDAFSAIPQSKTAWEGFMAYSSSWEIRLRFRPSPLDLKPVSTQE
jgi:hypothetical protein